MNTLSDFIKENLLSSFDADKVIQKLSDLNFILSTKKLLNQKYSTIKIEIDYSIYNDNLHKKLESLLNVFNYFVSNYNLIDDNKLIVIIKPRITECVTDYVNNQRFIYHLTNEEGWKGIQKSNGLKPKNANYEFRPKQSFLFVKKPNYDEKSIHIMSRQLSINSKSKKNILIKIDLEYVKNKKIKFYIDPAYSSNEFLAIYTRDFIPKLNKESFMKYEI